MFSVKGYLHSDSHILTGVVHVRPLLEYASVVWSPYLVKDISINQSIIYLYHTNGPYQRRKKK